jgi:two-component SAPR family response regulator
MPSDGKVLMIVDDEQPYLEMLNDIMPSSISCPIVTFSRPLAALEALHNLEAGVIITDYFMPQMNGIEFVRRARELAPGVSFLIITGHAPELNSQNLASLPEVREIISKPIRWQLLARKTVEYWNGSDVPKLACFD